MSRMWQFQPEDYICYLKGRNFSRQGIFVEFKSANLAIFAKLANFAKFPRFTKFAKLANFAVDAKFLHQPTVAFGAIPLTLVMVFFLNWAVRKYIKRVMGRQPHTARILPNFQPSFGKTYLLWMAKTRSFPNWHPFHLSTQNWTWRGLAFALRDLARE